MCDMQRNLLRIVQDLSSTPTPHGHHMDGSFLPLRDAESLLALDRHIKTNPEKRKDLVIITFIISRRIFFLNFFFFFAFSAMNIHIFKKMFLFFVFQVLTLGLAGGVTLKDTVWRVMKMLLQNDLACKINWTGLHGKTSFQGLEVKNVVTGKSVG